MSLINIEYKDIRNLSWAEKTAIKLKDIAFPKQLEVRICNCLFNEQIITLGQLLEKYKKERNDLKIMPHFGRKSFEIIEKLLMYSFPEVFEKKFKTLYTFNYDDLIQEKICTQIVK